MRFDNTYASLPAEFYSKQNPISVRTPKLLWVNEPLAEDLTIDLDWLNSNSGLGMCSGNHLPEGACPIAQVYSGHQFGHFSGQLGDGRALLLGELLSKDSRRFDLQLKGSGRTPYSRQGDGRSALGPVIRETIVSEGMYHLGIPTTRSLAVVSTGEKVYRNDLLPGGIMTRVASSHIRGGTFEYFATNQKFKSLRKLADYTIERHYPEILGSKQSYIDLLDAVMKKQAYLIASWLGVGFVHGVMNTDNFAVSGETLDFGPCAFMERYNPECTFSSIDHQGRYAYGNQSQMGLFNVTRFAECLLPLIDSNLKNAIYSVKETLKKYSVYFDQYWLQTMGAKLGLSEAREVDWSLIQEWLMILEENEIDFTVAFRSLSNLVIEADKDQDWLDHFQYKKRVKVWLDFWKSRLSIECKEAKQLQGKMNLCNPIYIPRNHLVERAIEEAVESNNLKPFRDYVQILKEPFKKQNIDSMYENPSTDVSKNYQTFCGT